MHQIWIKLRYFIEFSYNGTHYHGWQIQPNAITVQQVLNEKLSILLQQSIDTTGAGRTDSGVHAQQMYAHFDYEKTIDTKAILFKLNAILPKDIVVARLLLVEDTAHARFDATSRTYEYHIVTHKEIFAPDTHWFYKNELDVIKMNNAAQLLLDYTDFQSFSKIKTDVKTFNCQITYAQWQIVHNKLIFTITADRFLRNMVRAIVGTLINVGLNKVSLTEFENIITSKNRNNAGFSVPAHGLFLTNIKYPYL